jgi:hypothetical protein
MLTKYHPAVHIDQPAMLFNFGGYVFIHPLVHSDQVILQKSKKYINQPHFSLVIAGQPGLNGPQPSLQGRSAPNVPSSSQEAGNDFRSWK